MVAQFIEGLNMKVHAQNFLEEEIDGKQLLNAERDVFEDLGVTSHVECVKIAVLFKRELTGGSIMYCTVPELLQKQKKLESHEKALNKAGVDVDMLVFARQYEFLTELLKEIGIAKPLDRNRFDTGLKTVLDEYYAASSSSEQTLRMQQDFVAYSTPV